MRYDIVRYQPALRAGLVALYRDLISNDSRLNDAYFRWKHEDNPYAPEPLVYAALMRGEVVGMRGFLGARWHLGDSGVLANWLAACDLVIDPAHRGRKLSQQIMSFALADLASRGYRVTLNWSGNPVTRSLSLRAGWRLVGTYATCQIQTPRASRSYRWAKRIRQWPIVWRTTPALLRVILPPSFDRLDAAWSRSSGANPGIGHAPLPDEMSELVERLGATNRIRHVRDPAYYRWRYRNPLCDYRFVYWREARLEGFVVLQLRRDGNGADIRVVDWEASRAQILDEIFRRIVAVGGFDVLSMWTATMPERLANTLAALGFSERDESRNGTSYHPGLMAIGSDEETIRKAGLDEARLFSAFERWDLRMAHSDAY